MQRLIDETTGDQKELLKYKDPADGRRDYKAFVTALQTYRRTPKDAKNYLSSKTHLQRAAKEWAMSCGIKLSESDKANLNMDYEDCLGPYFKPPELFATRNPYATLTTDELSVIAEGAGISIDAVIRRGKSIGIKWSCRTGMGIDPEMQTLTRLGNQLIDAYQKTARKANSTHWDPTNNELKALCHTIQEKEAQFEAAAGSSIALGRKALYLATKKQRKISSRDVTKVLELRSAVAIDNLPQNHFWESIYKSFIKLLLHFECYKRYRMRSDSFYKPSWERENTSKEAKIAGVAMMRSKRHR